MAKSKFVDDEVENIVSRIQEIRNSTLEVISAKTKKINLIEQLNTIEKDYQLLISELDKETSKEQELQAVILKDLGNLKAIIGNLHGDIKHSQFSEAIDCYSQSLNIYKKLLEHEDLPQIAELYMILGKIHNNIGKDESAINYLDKSLKIFKSYPEDQELAVAIVTSIRGRCKLSIGKFNEGISDLKESIRLYTKIYNSEVCPEIVDLYQALGDYYKRAGQFETAINHFEQCERILELMLSEFPYPVAIAGRYNNVGRFFLDCGIADKAIQLFQKGLEILERSEEDSEKDNLTAGLLQNLGLVYQLQNEQEKAEKCLNKSFTIFKKDYNNELHPDIYKNLIDQANFLTENYKLDEASAKLAEAEHIMQQMEIPDYHPDRSLVYFILGSIASQNSDEKQAINYFRKCLKIQNSTNSANGLLTFEAFNNITKCQIQQNNIEEATTTYSEIIDFLNKKNYRLDHNSKLALIASDLAIAYFKQNSYLEALKYITTAFELIQFFPKNSSFKQINSYVIEMSEAFAREYSFTPQIILNRVLDSAKTGLSNPGLIDIGNYSQLPSLIEEYRFLQLRIPKEDIKTRELIQKIIINLKSVSENSFKVWLAVKNNDYDKLKELIKKEEIDLEVLIQNTTPLIQAVITNNSEIISLLSTKVNINKPDINGASPLYYSLGYHGQAIEMNIVKLLLNIGADPSQAMEDGDTPMHMAGYRARTDIMKLLLSEGADVNVVNHEGKTPMHLVIEAKEEATTTQKILAVKYLLSQGGRLEKGNESKSISNFLLKVKDYKGSNDELIKDQEIEKFYKKAHKKLSKLSELEQSLSQANQPSHISEIKETQPKFKDLSGKNILDESLYSNNKEIEELKRIEKENYSLLVKNLAYAETKEELEKLTGVFNDIAQNNIKLGTLSGEIKYYTNAAVLYQYIINIINDKLGSQNSNQISIEDAYQQLNNIQDFIITSIEGDKNLLKNVKEEANSNKDILIKLRNKVSDEIKTIETYHKQNEFNKYTNEARSLFETIASKMRGFLAEIYNEAQAQLGAPPCKYAVIGLGSMALQQITPYSDLEFAILTENDEYRENLSPKIRNYFKNLTHLVHFKIVCLGETVIPMSKYGIDTGHLTHEAINFDLGGKTPLGRIDNDKPYDLIRTIEKMLWYVKDTDNKASHIDKNLAHILQKVCHVYGDNALVKDYQQRVTNFLRSPADNKENQGKLNCEIRAMKLLNENSVEIDYLSSSTTPKMNVMKGNMDQLQFDPLGNHGKIFDVKQEIYRLPDRLLYNIGLHYGIEGTSAWDTVDQMQEKELITKQAAQNIKVAITFATMLRLKTYDYYKYQKEDMAINIEVKQSENEAKEQIAKIFHLPKEELEEEGNLFKYFYTALPLYNRLVDFCENYGSLTKDNLKDFFKEQSFYEPNADNKWQVHYRLLQYKKALQYELTELDELKNKYNNDDHPKVANLLNSIGLTYTNLGNNEQALKYELEGLDMLKNLFRDQPYHDTAIAYNNVGRAYCENGNFEKALEYQVEGLKILKTSFANNYFSIAMNCNNLGLTYHNLGDNKKALKFFNKALKLFKKSSDLGIYTALCLNNLGSAYNALGNQKNAITNYDKALKAVEKFLESNHPYKVVILNNISQAYKNSGDYKTYLAYGEQALKIAKELFNDNHPLVACSLDNLGNIYSDIGKYEAGLKHHLEAFEMLEKLFDNDHINVICNLNNIGAAYADCGQYRKGLEYKLRALTKINESFKGNHPIKVSLLNSVGSSYRSLGKDKEALELYKDALAMQHELFTGNHLSIVTTLSSISLIYKSLGNYSEALKYNKQALEMAKELLVPDHPTIGIIINNLAQIYNALGEPDKALEKRKEALEIAEKKFGKTTHPDLSLLNNNIATDYSELRDNKSGLEYCLKAFEIAKNFYSDDHPVMIPILGNIGSAYEGQGNYQEALRHRKKALKIARKTYEADHPDIIIGLGNLGKSYAALDLNDKAFKYHEEALEMAQRRFGKEPNRLSAVSLSDVGNMYLMMENYQQALECKLSALKMLQEIFTENHPDIVFCLNEVSRVYISLENPMEAIKYQLLALKMAKELPNTNPLELASLISNIGGIFYKLGNYNEALNYYKEALEIHRSLKPEDNQAIIELYNNVGVIYSNLGEYDQALKYQFESLEIKKTLLPDSMEVALTFTQIGTIYIYLNNYENALDYCLQAQNLFKLLSKDNKHPDIANNLASIGAIHIKQEKFKEGVDYQKQALAIYKEIFDINHPCIANCLSNIGYCYSQLNDDNKAIKYREKALYMMLELYPEDKYPHGHNDIASAYTKIAETCKLAGKIEIAETYTRKAVEIKSLLKADLQNIIESVNQDNKDGEENDNYLENIVSNNDTIQIVGDNNEYDSQNY